MKRILIIGGVAAGTTAAAKARRIDKTSSIVIYNRGEFISWGACGLPYYVGGFFDNYITMAPRGVDYFAKENIDVKIHHEVLSVSPETKTIKVKNLKTDEEFTDEYDSLLIATGASAFIPKIENVSLKHIFSLRQLNEGIMIKNLMKDDNMKNILIVGTGFIGIEAAHGFHNLGKNVRLLSRGDGILQVPFDKDIYDILTNHVKEQKNVNLHLNEQILSFEGDENNNVKYAITDKGIYECDLVIIATGEKPNTEFISDIGLKMYKNNAIIIDNECRTNIESIYAAGDCATVYHKVLKEDTYIPLATTANRLGKIVAHNLLGGHEKFEGTLGSACILVFDYEAARTGITERQAKEKGIDYKVTIVKNEAHTKYYPGSEMLILKIIYHAETRKILGAEIIGKKGAVLRSHGIAIAISAGLTVDDLRNLDLCYSPPFSNTLDIVNIAGNISH